VAPSEYLGTTGTYENFVLRKLNGDWILVMFATIRCRLLTSRLLSENLEIFTYVAVILPVVQYGCETWFLTLRENGMLRRIFGTKRREGVLEENG
jgi:hypothetical protein